MDLQLYSNSSCLFPRRSPRIIAIGTVCKTVLQSSKISHADSIRNCVSILQIFHTPPAQYTAASPLITSCNSRQMRPNRIPILRYHLRSVQRNRYIYSAPPSDCFCSSQITRIRVITSHWQFHQAEIFWFPSPRKQEVVVQSSRYGVARSQFQSSDEFLSLHLIQSSFLSTRLFIRSLGKDIPSLHLEIAPKRSFDTTEE